MNPDILLIPSGIITFILLAATLLMGIKGVKVKYHKLIAFAALAFGSAHVLIGLYEFLR